MPEENEVIEVNREDLSLILEIARFYTNWHDTSRNRIDFKKVCEFEIKYKMSYKEALGT